MAGYGQPVSLRVKRLLLTKDTPRAYAAALQPQLIRHFLGFAVGKVVVGGLRFLDLILRVSPPVRFLVLYDF